MIPHSPAASIVYSLWLRSRLIVGLSLAGTFALCAVAMMLGPVPRVVVGMGAGIAFMSGLALLIGVVTYGGADLSSPESVYPKHAMVFPASTRTLVLAPMLYGAAMVAIFWLILAAAAFRPAGLALPVFWPAGMVAAMVAWLQAASWAPYRVPFLRILMLLLVLAVLIPIGVAGQVHDLHPAASFALSLLVGAVAYPVALIGVSRARRGDGVSSGQTRAAKVVSVVRDRRRSRFTSPSAAQFWFDLVRNVWYPPAITLLVELVLVFTFIGGAKPRQNSFLPAWVPPGLPPLGILLSVPMFVIAVHAIVFGKFDMWTKSVDFPPFLLTRPVSTAGIIGGKLRTAAVVTVLVWLITALVIVTHACLPHSFDAQHSWARVAARHATWRSASAMALVALLLIILTWGQISRSMWISVSGKKWLIHAFPTFAMLVWGALGWTGYRLHQNSTLWRGIVANVGLVLAVAAIIRVLLSSGLLLYLVRRSLLVPATALKIFSAWVVGCGVLCAAVLLVGEPLRHAPVAVIAVITLFVPLFRPALAVLLLHYNRHR